MYSNTQPLVLLYTRVMHDSRFLRFSASLFDLTKLALILVVLAIAFIILVGKPLSVNGASMEPNFHSGQVVIVDQISFSGQKTIRRGDVVAAKFPADPAKTKLIKRVVGLPGETVEVKDTHLFINSTPLVEAYKPRYGEAPYDEIASVTLKDDEYFLAGDNRPGSSDSRLWGPVTRSDILGRVSFVIFPPADAQYVSRPGN
ncbi:MAG: signal peptidase I [Patescibacteria group bacterium]